MISEGTYEPAVEELWSYDLHESLLQNVATK